MNKLIGLEQTDTCGVTFFGLLFFFYISLHVLKTVITTVPLLYFCKFSVESITTFSKQSTVPRIEFCSEASFRRTCFFLLMTEEIVKD